MMRRLSSRFSSHGEEGFALISVIVLGVVISMLVATMMTISVSSQVKAGTDSDSAAALAAAYAGVQDYESKLANDTSYQQYGNPAAPFSSKSTFSGTNNNPAFSLGVGGTWGTVPVQSGTARASFRYEVDNSVYGATGVLRIRSTGRVNATTRTVLADVKQQGFLNYVYFTDYEISDPDTSSQACTPAYAWAVSSRPNCSTLNFGPQDVLTGPVHSNDTMLICGSTFNDRVDTSSTTVTSNGRYTLPANCAKPTFKYSADPSYVSKVDIPATNGSMKQETRSDLTSSTVPRPGCLYTGPTTITFNANGTMTIRSPWTLKTQIGNAAGTTGTAPAMCGTPGYAASGTLGSPAGQTIPIIDSNLIYVQDVPRTVGDANYWANTSFPTGLSCSLNGGSGNGVGYPYVSSATTASAKLAQNEVAPAATALGDAYGCDSGDVFVKGTFHGAMTVAASNYVYVVDDIKYADATKDILGLVGDSSVWVYNPVNAAGTPLDTSGSGIEIDAAILSVKHSFLVQNFKATGYKGVLTVNGAIIQRFRGPVAQTQSSTSNGVTTTTYVSGYKKNYLYDKRFLTTAPPKYLNPVSTTYGITSITEVGTAFSYTGAVK